MIPNDVATKRMFWVEHRTETYVGARYLINRALYSSAYILAAYSIEFSFKQLIGEHFNFDGTKINTFNEGKTIKSHNLETIYDKLVEEGIIEDMLSRKFLRSLTTEAKRYPTQKIDAWNSARGRQEHPGPLIMYYFDSVFTKIDYFILSRYGFNPKVNSSAFVRALSYDCISSYFAFNIHARYYFDRYARELKGYKVAKNGTCELRDIDKEGMYWDGGDINKDSEPRIPNPAKNISEYDDLNFQGAK